MQAKTLEGVVEVDGKKVDVEYHFINCMTIHCVEKPSATPKMSGPFDTHYKSLVVED